MRKIVILGSINLEVVVRPDGGAAQGSVSCGLGGKGANMAIAARRLGADVRFYSKVGDDGIGHSLIGYLKEDGIGSSGVFIGRGVGSNVSLLLLGKDGDYSVSRSGWGYKSITRAEVGSIKLDGSEIVMSAISFPQGMISELFARARKAGCTIMLNCGPVAEVDRKLLSASDYLVMNEAEFAFHSGAGKVRHGDAKEIARISGRIRRKGQVLVVTMGDRGFVAVSDGGTTAAGGHRVRAANTSGAGDCFMGAMATCLARGKSLEHSLMFANAAAAVSVEGLGAASSMPGRREVDRMLSRREAAQVSL